MTPKDLVERLGISERSVREKVYSQSWPHLRIDKRTVRFTEEDFQEIIESSRRKPTTSIRKASINELSSDLAALLKSRRLS
jgi:hypothetical protein